MKLTWIALLLLVCLLGSVAYSQGPGEKVPSVTMAAPGKVLVKAGGTTSLELAFRIGSEFHVNSNKPHSDLLIPTALKLTATSPLSVTSLKYPAGQDVSFPFAPDEKLSVYSGDFSIVVSVKVSQTAAAGNYPVTGDLRFQACDHSACYPPRSIPVKFEVTVAGR